MLTSDTTFRNRLLTWYDRHRRDLPWRTLDPSTGRPDPYHVLLSEFMLQQTQVATVVPYFGRFLEAFPTIRDLAAADEDRVLRLWQGLGYYSRARNLRRAAQAVVAKHGGTVPNTVDALLTLPGVGRYTAGAIASIAHGVPAPIVDGNVVRILCRLDAIREDPRDKPVLARLWSRAESLVPSKRPGDFNSAMMELGATVCAPRNPQCLICPVAGSCRARELGIQETIPPAKKAVATPTESRTIYCLHRPRGGQTEYAFEQRPLTGRWAGMWQFVTRSAENDNVGPTLGTSKKLGEIRHALTHRRYTFTIRTALFDGMLPGVQWKTLEESESLALPKPHVESRRLLAATSARK